MAVVRRVAHAAGCLGAAAGVAAVGYSGLVAIAWLRYGHASPPSADDADALLERFMPAYDIVERHRVPVAAPAATTFASAAEVDINAPLAIRAVFKARELFMGASPNPMPQPRAVLAWAKSIGWGVLAEHPGREIVLGAVTQPWLADVVFRSLPPDEFSAFNEPGFVKIAWTLRADAVGESRSVFRTETRAIATDPASRAKFRRYWSRVSPGVVLIRWLMLGPVKTAAERQARLLPSLIGGVARVPDFRREDAMRVHAIAAVAAGALLTLSCSSVRPIAIHDGDQCFRCRRPIVERATAAELMDGSTFGSKFRAPGCMAKYLADHPGETGTTFVTDYATGKWVRPDQALFVPVVVNRNTGESDYHAFSNKADADAAAAESHTVPVDWNTVLEKARS